MTDEERIARLEERQAKDEARLERIIDRFMRLVVGAVSLRNMVRRRGAQLRKLWEKVVVDGEGGGTVPPPKAKRRMHPPRGPF